MEVSQAVAYFRQPAVVEHYAYAANRVGLWQSEERIFSRLFKPEQSLLELGCGAGRIAFGLWGLGYRHIMATDASREMVAEARRINHVLEYGVAVHVQDATKLTYQDNEFDGAIFGFNGLMQIPGRARRAQAMAEIARVIRPGAWFVFTGHDRHHHGRRKFWETEAKLWRKGRHSPLIDEFGDLYYEGEEGGNMYIHAADSSEVREDLEAAGFRIEASILRSELCTESETVRAFSDDTRFWVAQKLPVAAGPEPAVEAKGGVLADSAEGA